MICNGFSLESYLRLSFTDSKDRRISRMACHKVAVDVLGPVPRTAKGEITEAGLKKYKESFVEIADWLISDVESAGNELARPVDNATMNKVESESQETPEEAPEYSLDEATVLIDKIKAACAGNDSLKQAVKLKLVALGVGNHRSLDEAVMSLNVAKAAELDKFIDKEK
jgi:hypothetical protein